MGGHLNLEQSMEATICISIQLQKQSVSRARVQNTAKGAKKEKGDIKSTASSEAHPLGSSLASFLAHASNPSTGVLWLSSHLLTEQLHTYGFMYMTQTGSKRHRVNPPLSFHLFLCCQIPEVEQKLPVVLCAY